MQQETRVYREGWSVTERPRIAGSLVQFRCKPPSRRQGCVAGFLRASRATWAQTGNGMRGHTLDSSCSGRPLPRDELQLDVGIERWTVNRAYVEAVSPRSSPQRLAERNDERVSGC